MCCSRIAIFVVALLGCVEARGQDYPIKMQRVMKVGDKYREEANNSIFYVVETVTEGKPVESTSLNFTTKFDGEVTALEVGESGQPMKLSVKVNKMTKTIDDHTEELIKEGTVIIATSVNKKTIFEIDDHPVAEKLLPVLRSSISLGRSDHTEDDLYGTSERKKAGDTWPVKAQRFEEAYQDDPSFRSEKVAGELKLERVDRRPTGDVEVITLHLTAKVFPPMPDLIMDDATREMNASTEFPVNLDEQPLSVTAKFLDKFTAHPKDPAKSKTTVKGLARQTHTSKTTPMK